MIQSGNIILFQGFTVLSVSSHPPPPPPTPELLQASIICLTLARDHLTTPVITTLILLLLAMVVSSLHTSTRRNSTNTGTTTIPGYQVKHQSQSNIFSNKNEIFKYFSSENQSTISGAYKRLDNEMLSSYYDRDRSKSKSPKPMFYKSPSPHRAHWGGYF